MDIAAIFVALKAIQNIMAFIENTADEGSLTPEFLDARDAVRQQLVDIANQL